MNSGDVAANCDNMIHHHVLEVALDDRSLKVRGIALIFTMGDMI
jgi:hypothetical protein